MASADTISSDTLTDPVAALRFIAAIGGQMGGRALSDEEAYGLEVIVRMIADKVEGRAA